MKKITLLLGMFFLFFIAEKSNAQTNAAFGDNQVEVETGVWAIYSGDVDQDGYIDILDYLILDADVQLGSSGYLPSDLNGDGFVDIFDYLILDVNIQKGVSVARPF
jgi:Dockerin type I domain